jgi:uncharacterized membrane protein YbhN (UPF0104 family)
MPSRGAPRFARLPALPSAGRTACPGPRTQVRSLRVRVRHVLHALVLLAGTLAFAFLLYRLGWDGLYRVIIGTGAWFAVMAAIDAVSVMCDAGGVHSFARLHSPGLGYWRVFAAQASGLAINRLTPGNSLGEPIKVTMLMEHVPETVAISAIVSFNLATILVAISVIVVGVPLTLLVSDLPPRVELVVWIATAILIAFALALALLIRRGAVGTLIDAAARLRLLGPARATRWRARIADIDRNVRQLGTNRRAFAFVIGSRILNWAGTVVLLHSLALHLTAPLVIGVLTVGLLVTWASNIIPLGLGLADGGNYALYGMLGAPPAVGLEFAMINRVRTCVLALIGLSVMAVANLAARRASE